MLAIQLDSVGKRYGPAGRARHGSGRLKVNRLRGSARKSTQREQAAWTRRCGRLRDVSLDVPQGAGLGIIGRNGAGKTTLLKLVSRVTWPTSGAVRIGGQSCR